MPTILPDVPAAETAIIEMTNAYRARQRLAPVSQSPALQKAAKAFADYLARTNSFAHDAGGTTLEARVNKAGYQYCQVSENLARALDSRGFATRTLAKETVEGWINSPGHRANIEAPGVTETGVAIARVPDQHPKYVTVQLFARPRTLAYEVQVANTTTEPVTYAFDTTQHTLQPHMAVTHTACSPGTLSFIAAGAGSKARKLSSRYEAKSGVVYLVRTDANGQPQVVVEPRRTIE